MEHTSPRGLLSTGTGLAVCAASCLGRLSVDGNGDSGDTDESREGDLSPLERNR